MSNKFNKRSLIRLMLLPFLAAVIWLVPLLWTFPIPAHYNIGLAEKASSRDIEVWDLGFYFPLMSLIIVATAFLARKIKIGIKMLFAFVVATVLGQTMGMTANLLIRYHSEALSGFVPFGLVFVSIMYTIIVMPFGLVLFVISLSIFNGSIKRVLVRKFQQPV